MGYWHCVEFNLIHEYAIYFNTKPLIRALKALKLLEMKIFVNSVLMAWIFLIYVHCGTVWTQFSAINKKLQSIWPKQLSPAHCLWSSSFWFCNNNNGTIVNKFPYLCSMLYPVQFEYTHNEIILRTQLFLIFYIYY